jgi:membrane protease YdiL (CAAX protease family)
MMTTIGDAPSAFVHIPLSIALTSLLVLWAVWNVIHSPRIKRSVARGKRTDLIRDYVHTIVGLTVLGTLGLFATRSHAFTLPAGYALDLSVPWRTVVYAVPAVMLFIQLTSVYTLRRQNDQIPRKLIVYLPLTRKEKWMFAGVALCAGVFEEILFRGFGLHLMAQLSVNFWVACLLTSLLFGLMHLYQGLTGFLQSLGIGFLFAVLFAATGHLLLLIVFHTVFDLINILIRKQPEDKSGNVSQAVDV